MDNKFVYADNAATTQVDPRVIDKMLPFFSEGYGNASSLYGLGQRAREAVEEARKKVAAVINADPKEIFFTSGGTESDNYALRGMMHSRKANGRKHLITTTIEHPAILQTCKALEKEGFRVVIAPDGGQGVELFRKEKPNLILLDLMLPVLDGWGVCRAIRQESDVPIIMLTAKGETMDKVSGLKLGADDYITKPFEMKEVLARIEAVLRRTSGTATEKKARRLVFDKMVIDMDAFELLVDGKKVDTPPKEMELLYYLASSPNRVYTRNQLLDEVWGFDYFGDSRTVDVHVKRLREKLEGVSESWSLKTVWGVGYKFEVL